MIKNYLKIAWRNLTRNKVYSFINIFGLAIGLACFVLISLYVIDELSYDRYNENADRIYRVDADITFGSAPMTLGLASDPMGATLKRDYPEVEAYTRFFANYGRLVRKGSEFINEPLMVHADSSLFDVFTLPMVVGEPKKALTEPQTVVISEHAALKYFGTTNVLGKSMEIKEGTNHFYKVTGVIKDIPLTSHFRFDFIFPMFNIDYQFGNYLSHNFPTYLLLKKGADPKKFDGYFKQVLTKYVLPQAKQFLQINTLEEFEKAGNKLSNYLTPLTSIHLHSDKLGELGANGSIQYVYIFSAVAIFILLIACINFMNLSTARSGSRSREVGIRKVLGSQRSALVRQFLSESFITVFIAMLFAVGIATLAIPYFNNIAAKELSITSLFSPGAIIVLVMLPLIVGLIAGSYPAFFLSAFKPIVVLKSKLNTGGNKSRFRSALVVFQFAISVILIIGTITIYKQLSFIQNKKIGFNREQVLIVDNTMANGEQNAIAFKQEILKISGVKSGTIAGFLPVANSARSDNTFSKDAVMTPQNAMNMQAWRVDHDYINTLGMQIVKGRDFSREYGTDSTAVIINETAEQLLDMGDPIGKMIYLPDGKGNATALKIIGVVKNFNYESMRSNIGPLILQLGNANWSLAFKVSSNNVNQLIDEIQSKYKTMMPSLPFSYKFMDDSFDQMYRTEQRAGKIALIFAVLTVLIACLGLFGLAAFMAEQRTKEIGVRKVLGASVNSLVKLMSKDFLQLISISLLIAIPVSALLMHNWLENFAFRISLSVWVFVGAAILTIVIAVFTTGFQAIKAALANPVKSLRSE